ncbi:dihydroorotate dehydrogenase [Pseudaestuariivita sp.]|uniref:dihydroorotate dehydrogenase n=1 Tax=Pseudaestuariivita sp. TaxID=2211669 RepID=UPI0040580EF3
MTDRRTKADKPAPEANWLDDLFAERREAEEPASPDLLARVLEDAYAAQPLAGPPEIEVAQAPWWRQVLDAVGGWPAAAGLVTAGLGGLWIGWAQPAALDAPLQVLALGDVASLSLLAEPEVEFFALDASEGGT